MADTPNTPFRRGALWVFPDGRTLPVISGAADDDRPAGGDQDTKPAKGDDDQGLGDAGKRAQVDAERKARRDAEQAVKDLQAKLDEISDRDKSETQKLSDRLAAAEAKAAQAEANAMRLEVAGSKGLTPAQAKRLVGATREELEADADELLSSFTPATGGDDKGDPPRGRPTPDLAPGGSEREDPEPDVDKVLEKVPRL